MNCWPLFPPIGVRRLRRKLTRLLAGFVVESVQDNLGQFIGGIPAEVAGRCGNPEADPSGCLKDQIRDFASFDSTHMETRT